MPTSTSSLALPQQAIRRLPAQLLDAPIDGVGLRGRTAADETAGGPTVWIFLRHFG